MIFPWSREHRRRELLAQPFSEAWRGWLNANVWQYGLLTEADQNRLRDDLRVLIAEKDWEGGRGFAVTDKVRVTIAAQAALLLLGLKHDYFGDVETVIVYPASYVATERTWGPGGVLNETPTPRLGETSHRGPVIVSWADALAAGRGYASGRNVVLHEFAHRLDLRNGDVDGVPPLGNDRQYEEWSQVMSAEYENLVADAQEGRPTLLDQYGATNAGEFFAVATECFFETPHPLQHIHPRLYAVLRDFYRQDPAARMPLPPPTLDE